MNFIDTVTPIIREWAKNEMLSDLRDAAIIIGLYIAGKFIIWPKIVDFIDKLNGRN